MIFLLKLNVTDNIVQNIFVFQVVIDLGQPGDSCVTDHGTVGERNPHITVAVAFLEEIFRNDVGKFVRICGDLDGGIVFLVIKFVEICGRDVILGAHVIILLTGGMMAVKAGEIGRASCRERV